MNFADKLKELRKSKNMSQELLAEKLYVSRQAITKWENGTGLPDIANIVAISALFNESLDALLSEEKNLMSRQEFLYRSVTQYDLECAKEMELHFGTAHQVIIERTASEKIEVVLSSNKLHYLEQQVKVKIEENKKRMDVRIRHTDDLTDLAAKRDLFVMFRIPQKFVAHLEITGQTENLKIRDIHLDNLEFGGKLKSAAITNAKGHIEMDCSCDATYDVDTFAGKLDINQWKAVSVVTVKNSTVACRRMGKNVRFLDTDNQLMDIPNWKKLKDAEKAESAERNADFVLECAGWKSELKVIRVCN
ncbi:MAG: helix-turn-helix domain-containing protein [Treponemataceae bacterium]|nr:helix-turn-helix domain-containing protein [Treponemataceae bacterium]